MRKNKTAMFILLFLIILFAKDVYAIGVGPSSMRSDFEPGLEKNLEFVVSNNVNEPDISINESIEKTNRIEHLNFTSAFFIVSIFLIVILVVIIQKKKVKKFKPDSIAVTPQKQ